MTQHLHVLAVRFALNDELADEAGDFEAVRGVTLEQDLLRAVVLAVKDEERGDESDGVQGDESESQAASSAKVVVNAITVAPLAGAGDTVGRSTDPVARPGTTVTFAPAANAATGLLPVAAAGGAVMI